MFCHQCGAGINDPSDRFCSRCGAPLHHGGAAESPDPGPQSPLAEPAEDRHRRPISAWPDRRRERIQLPLTELRQRRARETGEPVPLLPATVPAPAVEPPAAEPPILPDVGIPDVDTAGAPEEPLSTSRSRAEAALLRMVPAKEAWAMENQIGPAERAGVRDEWPGPAPRGEVEPPEAPPAPAPAPVTAAPAPKAPPEEDPIIAWLEPSVTPVRPAPPSREVQSEEGPIIVPRDYDENAARQRKGRRAAKARGPLFDPAALGRSIKPSWILAIAGVILLTLIVFAIFPPGGGNEDGAGPDKVNRFTGMPILTVATPVRPTAGTPAIVVETPVATPAADPVSTAEPAASSLIPGLGALPPVATPTPETTVASETPAAAPVMGEAGIRVVVSSAGGWSGTIGQQAETYTETPVVGSGTQARTITGPVTMVTANIQKLDQTTDLLEVRVEQDGVLLKSGKTTEPAGIVALSVQV